MKLVVLMTVHNRCVLTLRALRALAAQALPPDCKLEVVVVDDGSTDGTAVHISNEFRGTRVVEGDGQLYWNRGMALAQTEAEGFGADALLWLNDDVDLFPDAVTRALSTLGTTGGDGIIVGATKSMYTGGITYSGARLRNRRPGSQQLVEPGDQPIRVDTFNGNFVLVPSAVADRLGTVDPLFSHSYGDIDYGLRARRIHIPVWLMPGTIGYCERNSPESSWRWPGRRRRERIRLLLGRKGVPWRDHLRFLRRHAPTAWPLYMVGTYSKAVTRIILGL